MAQNRTQVYLDFIPQLDGNKLKAIIAALKQSLGGFGKDISFIDKVSEAFNDVVKVGADFEATLREVRRVLRCATCWALEATMEQSLTLAALEMALIHHTPSIHHSDHGVQYAALAYTERLTKAGVAISMASIGEPTENGYA
jgi:alkylhydroperoxidase family enzyme